MDNAELHKVFGEMAELHLNFERRRKEVERIRAENEQDDKRCEILEGMVGPLFEADPDLCILADAYDKNIMRRRIAIFKSDDMLRCLEVKTAFEVDIPEEDDDSVTLDFSSIDDDEETVDFPPVADAAQNVS